MYVRIHRSSTNDRPDRIIVSQRIAQALYVKGANPIRSSVAISRGVKSMTCRCFRQHTSLHGAKMLLGGLDEIGTSNNGCIAFTSR